MTVWVPAKRSSRIYEKNVQYNDRTDKKLESLFPHSRHLLPPTDRGEEESLTAIVQNREWRVLKAGIMEFFETNL